MSSEASQFGWNGASVGLSIGTIRRWSDLGYLESYRTPGGQRRFSQEQIEQFIESLQGGRPAALPQVGHSMQHAG